MSSSEVFYFEQVPDEVCKKVMRFIGIEFLRPFQETCKRFNSLFYKLLEQCPEKVLPRLIRNKIHVFNSEDWKKLDLKSLGVILDDEPPLKRHQLLKQLLQVREFLKSLNMLPCNNEMTILTIPKKLSIKKLVQYIESRPKLYPRYTGTREAIMRQVLAEFEDVETERSYRVIIMNKLRESDKETQKKIQQLNQGNGRLPKAIEAAAFLWGAILRPHIPLEDLEHSLTLCSDQSKEISIVVANGRFTCTLNTLMLGRETVSLWAWPSECFLGFKISAYKCKVAFKMKYVMSADPCISSFFGAVFDII